MGRELEKLNFYWLEESLYDVGIYGDVDVYGLKMLTDKLDIPICGTEVIAGSHYSAAYCIQERIVDMAHIPIGPGMGIELDWNQMIVALACAPPANG